MIASDDLSAVKIYSIEGNVKFTMKVPEDHEVLRVVFHHGIGKIIVLTYVRKQDSWFLLGYSEKGELENSVFLTKVEYVWQVDIKSHSNGAFAVKVGESITFI